MGSYTGHMFHRTHKKKSSIFLTLKNETDFSKRFSLAQLTTPVSLVDFDDLKLS